MNKLYVLPLLAAFLSLSAAAQDVAAPEAAASQPEVAVAPVAAASAPEVVVREGYVYKLQHCSPGGGSGTRLGNIFKNTLMQLSNSTGVTMLAKVVAADAVGNAVGDATETTEEDQRKVCVTVAFKDGTDDVDTVISLATFERRKLRIRESVYVRFEDGKPSFYF